MPDALTSADTALSLAKMRKKRRRDALGKTNKKALERRPYLIRLAQVHIFGGHTREESISIVAEEFGVPETKVQSYLIHFYDEIKAHAEEILEEERNRMELELRNTGIQTLMELSKKAKRANEKVDQLLESGNDMAVLRTVQHVHSSVGVGGNKGIKSVHFHMDTDQRQKALDMLGFGEVIDAEVEEAEDDS